MTRDERDPERDDELARLLERWSAPVVPDGIDERVLAGVPPPDGRGASPGGRASSPRASACRCRWRVGVLMLLIVTAALALRPVAPPPTAAGPSEPVQAARRGGRAGGVADEPRRVPAGDRGDGHRGDRPRRRRVHEDPAAVLLVAAGLAATARADERFAFATLENGTSVGFALVRTGEAGPSGSMGEAALPRSNSVSRVLWDRESGAYFGYRVEVERKDGPRPFRVSFKPLDRGAVERELKQRGECPGCPAPAPLGTGPRFPAPQLLAEGEVLTLELLANPSTGERILDVVKLSARAVSAEAMRTGPRACSRGSRPCAAPPSTWRGAATPPPPRSTARPWW